MSLNVTRSGDLHSLSLLLFRSKCTLQYGELLHTYIHYVWSANHFPSTNYISHSFIHSFIQLFRYIQHILAGKKILSALQMMIWGGVNNVTACALVLLCILYRLLCTVQYSVGFEQKKP